MGVINPPGGYLPPPVQLAASTADTGGTIPANSTFRMIITALNENGETTGSNEVDITTSGTATNTITWNWEEVPGATEYRLYVTDANGQPGTEEFHASAPAGTTSWLRTGAPGNFANRWPPVTNSAFISPVLLWSDE